jgi:hypothetical protein
MADMLVLEASGVTRVSSSLTVRTIRPLRESQIFPLNPASFP